MLHTVLQILQIICCLGVIATVLLQSGRSAGLSGSISGGAETFLGKAWMISWQKRLLSLRFCS